MKNILVGVISLLFSFPVFSEQEKKDQFTLFLGQWTRHEIPDEKYNETHGLIGFEYNGWGMATFVNSYYDRAHLIGYSDYWYKGSYLDFSIKYSLVFGYEDPVVPMPIPCLTFKYKTFPIKLDLHYLPAIAASAGFRISF
jgi:hypothetical protein